MAQVHLSGGIGNQLFQVGFAHYLNLIRGTQVSIRKPKLAFGLPHTHLSFFDGNFFCQHCTYTIDQGNRLWNELMNPWKQLNLANFLGRFEDFRNRPFLSPRELGVIQGNTGYLGYFQNIEFVLPIADVIQREITQVLEERVHESLMVDYRSNLEVIHVRQGDTKSLANRKRVGVLDHLYYQKLLERKSKRDWRVVVTDDVEGAQEILQGIEVDKIFGPSDLDPWETLWVMANSRRLVAANSTFSWWGGFLALENGAEVVIPKPFFVSSELDTKGALKYPGFKEAESSFIQ